MNLLKNLSLKRINIKSLIIAFLIVFWLTSVWISDLNQENLRIYFLDVGQGDSILLRCPSGINVLVDGGGGDFVLAELGEVFPPWVRSIDIIVLTHPHADHVMGLLDVISRYEIGEVWWNPVDYGFGEYRYLAGLCEVELNCVPLQGFREVILGKVRVQVLWPLLDEELEVSCIEESFCGLRLSDNLNNDSIVLNVIYGDFSCLLMGDAEHEVEEILMSSILVKKVDVLKAGHHCSRTASGVEFLSIVSPSLAICSCGLGNRFDHPHTEALDRLDGSGSRVVRTDLDGRVEILSDGTGWRVR